MGYHYPSYMPTQHPTQLMPNRAGRTAREEGGCLLCRLGTAQPPAMLCVENREGLSGPPWPGTQPSRAGVGGRGLMRIPFPPFHTPCLAGKEGNAPQSESLGPGRCGR